MNKFSLRQSFLIVSLLILLTVGLTGCVTPSTLTPEATAVPATPEPTVTATATPNRLVVYDPTGQSGAALSAMLADFAANNALGFETWTTLTGTLDGVKIVVLYSLPDNLSGLAASAPQTQFIGLSSLVTPGGNVSSLAANPTHLAFMAGFITALTAEEWRAGGLIVDDAALGLSDAFFNGGAYVCGRCVPIYMPLLYYPQVYILAKQSDATAWTAQAAALYTDTAANSVFIDQYADYPEVLDQFPNALFFTSNATSPNLTRYTAVLGAEVISALHNALPQLLAGNGGQAFTARVGVVVNNNDQIITPGKLTLFNQVAQDLIDNNINPLSVP